MTFVSPSSFTRDGDNFAPPTFGGAVAVKYGSITFANTTATTLFTLPAGAVVVDFYANITELFDDTGTDLINFGLGDDPDHFVDDLAGGTAGLSRAGATSTVATRLMNTPLTEETAVTGIYAGQNSNADQGAATFCVFYILAS